MQTKGFFCRFQSVLSVTVGNLKAEFFMKENLTFKAKFKNPRKLIPFILNYAGILQGFLPAQANKILPPSPIMYLGLGEGGHQKEPWSGGLAAPEPSCSLLHIPRLSWWPPMNMCKVCAHAFCLPLQFASLSGCLS